MKNILKINACSLSAFLLILLCRCSTHEEKSGKILSVQLNTDQEAQTVHLSQLMDVDRIVALETKDSVLLPENFEIALTEKFIITLPHELFNSNTSIYQFDSTGKFMRVLAKGGKGPMEFIRINVYAVDAKKEILYYMHAGDKDHIQRIDLNSGKFLERIAIPVSKITRTEGLLLADLHILPDGTIACTPRAEPGKDDLSYQIFYITPEGEFAGGVPAYTDKGFINPFARTTVVDGELHYFGNTPDTLFAVRDTVRTPLMIINTPAPFALSSKEGHVLYGLMETPSSLICMAVHIPIEKMNADIWKEPMSGIFFIDKEKGQATKVSLLDIDALNMEMEPVVFAMYRYIDDITMLQEVWFKNIFTSGELGAVKVDASTFKEKAARMIAEGTVSSDILTQVQKLNDQLNEESNPVLVIGSWK